MGASKGGGGKAENLWPFARDKEFNSHIVSSRCLDLNVLRTSSSLCLPSIGLLNLISQPKSLCRLIMFIREFIQ